LSSQSDTVGKLLQDSVIAPPSNPSQPYSIRRKNFEHMMITATVARLEQFIADYESDERRFFSK
jgi:hypothetical protein